MMIVDYPNGDTRAIACDGVRMCALYGDCVKGAGPDGGKKAACEDMNTHRFISVFDMISRRTKTIATFPKASTQVDWPKVSPRGVACIAQHGSDHKGRQLFEHNVVKVWQMRE